MRKMITLFVFAVFCFCTGQAQAPANDNCAGAIALSCGGSYSGTTAGATNDVLPASACSDYTGQTAPGMTNGVWFTYTAPADGTVTFSTVGGATWDTYLRVYSGSCGALTCAGYNDDYSTSQSRVTVSVTQGTSYYILLTGYESYDYGAYTLTTTCTVANDFCTTATDLVCGSTITGNTTAATDEMIVTDPNNPANNCGYITAGRYKGVWFHYHASTDGLLTVTAVSAWGAALRVYSGSCGALTCAGHQEYGDLINSEFHNSVTVTVAAGTDYYILLAGFSANNYGNFTFSTDCVCSASITTQPVGASYCQNAAPTPLSVAATGFITSYQWYVNIVNSRIGGIAVSSDSSYTPSTSATGIKYYYAVINGGCNTDTSDVVAVNVGTPITSATLSAQQTAVCYGSQILLTASAQGSSKSYTYNYINVNDNSSTGYTSNKTKNEPAGAYVVAIKNSGGCIDTSNIVTITQPASPIAITPVVTSGICGGNGKIQVSAAGGYGDFVYTINNSSETGKTTPYTFANLAQGKYTLTAIDAHGCTQVRTVTIGNTTKVPAITGFTGLTTVLNGSATSYHVDSAYNVSYTWTVPSDAVVVSGQGTATASIKWGYKSGKIKITPSSSCAAGVAKQYSITVTHSNSFEANRIQFVKGDAAQDGIRVYPNPTRDIATLQFASDGVKKYTIAVMDLQGKVILRKDVTAAAGTNQVKLDVKGMANGVYLIRITDGKTVQNIKLVKGD